VKIESRVDGFMDRVERDFGLALDDAAEHAAALPGSPSDLRAERLGPLHGRIGSSKPYAKAQEKGAYITPKRRRALKFVSGRFSMRARIPAKHYLAKTGRRWGAILVPRLRTS